jgi:hypothetical protein
MAAAEPRRDDLWKADLLGVGDTLVEVPERVAVVEVRRVDRMAGLPQFVSEVEEPGRLPLRMMKQEQRRHDDTVANVALARRHDPAGTAWPAGPLRGRSARRYVDLERSRW